MFTKLCLFFIFQTLMISFSSSLSCSNVNEYNYFEPSMSIGFARVLVLNVWEEAGKQRCEAFVIKWFHGCPPKLRRIVTGANILQEVAGGGRSGIAVFDQLLVSVSFASMSFGFGACTFVRPWSLVVSSHYIDVLNKQPTFNCGGKRTCIGSVLPVSCPDNCDYSACSDANYCKMNECNNCEKTYFDDKSTMIRVCLDL